MRKVYFILGLAVLAALIGCSKGSSGGSDDGPHDPNPSDTIPPVVEIQSPGEGQVFTSGNTISITGKITDAAGLYRGSIRITNDASSAVVKEQLYEIHGFQLYNFNLSHTASVTTVSNYTVTVSFEDHGLNMTTKSVKIKVNP